MKHIKKFENFSIDEGFDDPWRKRLSGGKEYSDEEYSGEVDAKSFLNRRELDSSILTSGDDYNDTEFDDEVEIDIADDLYPDEYEDDDDYANEYEDDEDDEDGDEDWWKN